MSTIDSSRLFLAAALSGALASGPSSQQRDLTPLPQGASAFNLGVASSVDVQGVGITVHVVPEASEGVDLNGDGDSVDLVLHVFVGPERRRVNLGVALRDTGRFAAQGGTVAVAVSEAAQGGLDRNGDGDAHDDVLAVWDVASRTLQNTGLAAQDMVLSPDGSRVAFSVYEVFQGVDLNGDGDKQDRVAHLFHLATRKVTNSRLATGVRPFVYGQGMLSMFVKEDDQEEDLNGDGDQFDRVPRLYDDTLGVQIAIPLASTDIIVVGTTAVAFVVREAAQAQTDLNGDGDVDDLVLHFYDRASGQVTNLGLAVVSGLAGVHLAGDYLAFEVSERGQGQDLNGDGDMLDRVTHLYDLSTGVLANLGYSATLTFSMNARFLVTHVQESEVQQDLNGDGDMADFVPEEYRLATGQRTNLAVAGTVLGIGPSSDLSVLYVGELSQGVDLNGDGDLLDATILLYGHATSQFASTGLATGQPILFYEDTAYFPVVEQYQGDTDLNGDGDTDDRVLHVIRGLTEPPRNLRLDMVKGSQLGRRLTFGVRESFQGGTDLNGDGDTDDVVAHVAVLGP